MSIKIEDSTYPISRLFKPVQLGDTTTAKMVAAFRKAMGQEIPPTQQDINYESRWGRPPRPGTAHDHFDSEDLNDWKQVGVYWVRQVEGPHAHCWTTSRVNTHCWWRNAPNSYCCAGLPSFYEGALVEFRKEMEMVKPILNGTINGIRVHVSLERTLRPPKGTCWGISTDKTFLRISTKPILNYKDLGTRVPHTYAALERELSLFGKTTERSV